jgi:hypothetical protein
MPLDRTTEAIAHFIGLFHVDSEAARLRTEYDAFRGKSEALPEPGDHPEFTINIRSPHDLKGFEPGLKVPLSDAPAQSVSPVVTTVASGLGADAVSNAISIETPGPIAEAIQSGQGMTVPHWIIPLPNSIVTLIDQSLTMSDDDLLVFGHSYQFVDPSISQATLQELASVADGLSLGISTHLEAGQVLSVDDALSVLAAAQGLDASGVEGATATMIEGDAAFDIYVNGTPVEAMPEFRDNVPASMQDKYAEKEEEEADPPGPDVPIEEDNPFAVEPGHHVSTGENLAANEAYVGISWVDAGVIAVAGDVVSLNLISQVNVLSEHDSGGLGGGLSQVINAAQIEIVSSEPEGGETAEAAGQPVFPRHWQVQTVEGDVVLVNWVEQHIFATDNDRAEIEFSAAATAIGLGENTLANVLALVELGFHYDLIIIGGNMISFNLIEQINVLLDSDAIAGAAWPEGGVSSGDNLLMNSGTITATGVDTFTAMTDLFRAEIAALAAGAGTISDALAADLLFEGMETLSVLYITGDLIKMNVIEQTNYVGDADQVHLALEEFIAENGGEVTLIVGSNALLNAATIEDSGIDSAVLVGGEIYSDALIYQAELIDTDAAPEGVALAALTNEAVAAFLASDMIDPDPLAAEDAGGGHPLPTDSGSLDVMQSALA